jgi:hypothetical protein
MCYLYLTLRLALCRQCATSVNILSSFSLYGCYMFRNNRPTSVVHIALMKETASLCNAVLLPLCSYS